MDAMLPYLTSLYGNPHSRTHAYGWESEEAVENARKVCMHVCVMTHTSWLLYFLQQVANLVGADPREIVFTSGATESNNMAIKV